jgi:hypothetical protein
MNWILPVLEITLALTLNPIEYGVNNGGYFITDLPDQIVTMDTTVGVILFEHLGIEGDALVYTSPPWIRDGATYFAPFQSDFYFRTYLTFGGVEFGWEHLCTHPTLTLGENWDRRYGGKNTFYLTYKLEVD